MSRYSVIVVSLGLLAVLAVTVVVRYSVNQDGQDLTLPALANADYEWIASRIYQNEAAGQPSYLTHWGEGEDFPSLGIGHFIWFPQGVDAPFDESFPNMISFVQRHDANIPQPPQWLQALSPFDAPWTSKRQFDRAWPSPEMTELREWLQKTARVQAIFIVATFEQRWRNLDIPAKQKQRLTGLLQQLVATAPGLFAVVDYYNFKGLGNNPRERYQGQGWGLKQVLEDVAQRQTGHSDNQNLIEAFSDAAAERLRLRVRLSPPERNEARWLDGWMQRLAAYTAKPARRQVNTEGGFRLTPYVQNPAENGITLIWFSNAADAGQVTVWEFGRGIDEGVRHFESEPVPADALYYHPAEVKLAADPAEMVIPYLHELRLSALLPGKTYRYEVSQNSDKAGGSFRTPGSGYTSFRFIVYADSETEPESRGKFAPWPGVDGSDQERLYPVDQSTGYAENLTIIRQRNPDFVAIAGDLVQSGGEQRDWNEFWLHNADLASSIVILPALGNHEYFGGPGQLGRYTTVDSERAIRKYRTYFDLPHDASIPDEHDERYYDVAYGPVSLIVLDTTDGLPHRTERDANWILQGEGEGGVAPDWHSGSAQYRWLENALGKAQRNSQFTFVMFHATPYTSGVHGVPPGDGPGQDILSALPQQALTPLFLRFGVDAVFGGHDEMYEHSVVNGEEVLANGGSRSHPLHFFDIGIGGDGLRGPLDTVTNEFRTFLAHADAPEVIDTDGLLQDGGKHYGHLEVNVGKNANGQWQARIDAVYVFPVTVANGGISHFQRRLYDDSTILTGVSVSQEDPAIK